MAVSKAFTSAGTVMSVSSGAPATYNVAGFGALAWTAVGEIVDLGSFGKKYNLVTHNPIDDRKTVKRKGSYNSGTLSLKMARVPSNAGQAILVTASNVDTPISVKIVLQDGTIDYFQAVVMGYTTEVGSVDTITSATVDVEVTEDIVEVPAP
jgi:hypothetical protein